MSVIPITLFFSLLLAGSFVALFAREQRRRRFGSAERDSLLPLADETPRVEAFAPDTVPTHSHEHDHAHDDSAAHPPSRGKGRCGCREGIRPPCSGCRRRAGAALTSSVPHR